MRSRLKMERIFYVWHARHTQKNSKGDLEFFIIPEI